MGALRTASCASALAALLISLAGCAHHGPARPGHASASVLVEEYVSALPVGVTIHLCLERLACRTNLVRSDGRRNPPQIDTLPLPRGVSSRGAEGWRLHGYAISQGVTYRGTARLIYHTAVDPPCKCAGDYAYLEFRPSGR